MDSTAFSVAAIALAAALTLASPRTAFAQAAAGSISSANGQVQVQRGAATSIAGAGTALSAGDRVFTGTNSRATLSLADGSTLELGPSTSMTIDSAAAGAPTRVGLFSGVLRSIVNAGGGVANYQVHTPNAVAAVRGTRFDTAYSEGVVRPAYEGCDRYTDVSVYAGRVNLANTAAPNAGTDVDAGYEATVPCNGEPTSPGPLAMTGAASMESAVGSGGFVGTLPGSSGAPPPACPVCPAGESAPPPSGPPSGPPPNPGLR